MRDPRVKGENYKLKPKSGDKFPFLRVWGVPLHPHPPVALTPLAQCHVFVFLGDPEMEENGVVGK